MNACKIYEGSILAGMMIAIAGTANLSVDNKYLGAFLFPFGLITIIVQQWWLYTGKIGVIKLKSQWRELPLGLLGNFLGVVVVVTLLQTTRIFPNIQEKARIIVDAKLNDSLWSIFILAAFCGIMMYLAVDEYKKKQSLLMVIFPVMIFILCGFEHSIANVYYFAIAYEFSLKGLIYIITMVVGNTIGSLLIKMLKE